MASKSISALLLILLGMLSAPTAMAALVTFQFSGYIDQEDEDIDPLLASTFSSGDIISGSYTFESTTPDSDERDSFGQYFALVDFSLTVGSYTATYESSEAAPGEIWVVDGGVNEEDSYEVSAGLTGASVGGIPLSFTALSFRDSTLAMFSSTDLPLDAAMIAPFGPGSFQLSFVDDSDPLNLTGSDLYGTITNIQTSVVPLPGALILFLSGLVSVFISKQRFRHRA